MEATNDAIVIMVLKLPRSVRSIEVIELSSDILVRRANYRLLALEDLRTIAALENFAWRPIAAALQGKKHWRHQYVFFL